MSFFEPQDTENAWPFDTLKKRFIDFSKIVFQDVQKAEYESTEPFAFLNHHLSDFIGRFSRCPGSTK
jgi:hypothetical protein